MAQHDKLVLVVVLVGTLVGAYCDFRWFRVPNVLTLTIALGGLLFHAFFPTGSLSDSLAGITVGFGLLIVPYALGLMGAGDVKLLAATGAWLGVWGCVIVFIISSLVSGMYGTALILHRGKFAESWRTIKLVSLQFATLGMAAAKVDWVAKLVHQPDRRLRVIPYGVTLPFGVVGYAVWKWYMTG